MTFWHLFRGDIIVKKITNKFGSLKIRCHFQWIIIFPIQMAIGQPSIVLGFPAKLKVHQAIAFSAMGHIGKSMSAKLGVAKHQTCGLKHQRWGSKSFT
jgi:hypothetical protein